MRKIPGDSQIRAKLDTIEPALFHPMFADIVAELVRPCRPASTPIGGPRDRSRSMETLY